MNVIIESVLQRVDKRYPDELEDNREFVSSQLEGVDASTAKSLMLAYLNNTLRHWAAGFCPDETQPASVDGMCVACEVMVRLRAFVEANYDKGQEVLNENSNSTNRQQ